VPCLVIYPQVDRWQNLASVGRAIEADAGGRPLVLMAPDETTRAFIDMYARTEVGLIEPPVDDGSLTRLRELLARTPNALVAVQLPGKRLAGAARELAEALGLAAARTPLPEAPPWANAQGLEVAHRYELPDGRRYVLLETAR
jgi:hypothetical protein